MIKKICLICLLLNVLSVSQAHEFTNSYGGTVIESFELSGMEIWDSYFLPDTVLLAKPSASSQQGFIYISQPPYNINNTPKHRQVCLLNSRAQGNDFQHPCNDEFPHVHIDDFKMAMDLANEMCQAYGSGVVPKFNEPSTFVGIDESPAASHHYFYQLEHGLKFDCVELPTY